MIMAHEFPIKEEFICNGYRRAINDKIESAIAEIKGMATDEDTVNRLVLEAVKATYQAARKGAWRRGL